MPTKTIYATTDAGRLGATLAPECGQALVWRSDADPKGGAMFGWYNLDRFDGGRLTPTTLKALFKKED